MTGAQALRNTLDLARLADDGGYGRYWVAEHHGSPALAGACPEVLVAAIAATTSRLRVGSGGVMLAHYSPYKVCETFSALSGLFPGRIDLGIGRTDGSDDPVTVFALRRDRHHPAPEDFGEQLAELLGLLDGAFQAEHLFAALPALLPGAPERPELWLLGSSGHSATWAAQLGLRYAYADFINPAAGVELVGHYRERFVAGEQLAEPRAIVAVRALCADSDAEAARLAATARPERKRMLHGSPDSVRDQLERLAAEYGVDELLVVCVTQDHEARRRSYELLADAFSLAA
jgi:luciferase family oxidoreductase group 1